MSGPPPPAGHPELVTGVNLGVPFPTSIEALIEHGTEFLTTAFRASGALGPDNRVSAVTRAEEFVGGGAGRKLWLSVKYERADPGLHTELFVKMPRDFGDPLRQLFSALMEPEVRFALLSRRAGFPVDVPACYFGDYDPVTSTGLLITERITYGENGVEPFFDKCLDYELPDPLGHYRALISAIARLAAGHKTGRLGTDIEDHYPFHAGELRADDLIPYAAAELDAKIETLVSFAERYPRLLPADISSPDFLARFAEQAPRFLAREREIKRFLNADPDFVALCHWNANVDNAWFTTTQDGRREAGLLDWGSVGQMNVAQSIYGALAAMETGLWDTHKDDLVALFADEYRRYGGPTLDIETLGLHVQLYVALLGITWMLDAPNLVETQIPDLPTDADRFHPAFRADFLARAQLQLMTVFLHSWHSDDLPAALDLVPEAN